MQQSFMNGQVFLFSSPFSLLTLSSTCQRHGQSCKKDGEHMNVDARRGFPKDIAGSVATLSVVQCVVTLRSNSFSICTTLTGNTCHRIRFSYECNF